jgi:hypothetical protein
LDPAGPYFENTDPSVRLAPTDALFVDVIHTDGSHTLLLGFGTLVYINILQLIVPHLGGLQKMGHVDFYPNGGYNQPKCSTTSGKIVNLILQVGTMNIDGTFIDTYIYISLFHLFSYRTHDNIIM